MVDIPDFVNVGGREIRSDILTGRQRAGKRFFQVTQRKEQWLICKSSPPHKQPWGPPCAVYPVQIHQLPQRQTEMNTRIRVYTECNYLPLKIRYCKIFPYFMINLMIFIIEKVYLVHREFQLMATFTVLQVNVGFLLTLVFNFYYLLFKRLDDVI